MGIGWRFIRGALGSLILGAALFGWSNNWLFPMPFFTLDLSFFGNLLPDPKGGGFNSIVSGAVITIIAWFGAMLLYKASRQEKDVM